MTDPMNFNQSVYYSTIVLGPDPTALSLYSVNVTANTTITLKLVENPSTGYKWVVNNNNCGNRAVIIGD